MAGGPSLVATTSPRFEAVFRRRPLSAPETRPFHPESPAGRLWGELSERPHWGVEWRDAHGGLGGFGASTAQFAAVCAFGDGLGAWESGIATSDWTRLLELYRSVAWSGEGGRPSGADLIAQIRGGVSAFEEASGLSEVFAWPFPGLDLTLLRTGRKLATHEHLREIVVDGSHLSALREGAVAAVESMRSGDAAAFCAAIACYGERLATLRLCAERTVDLLAQARRELGELVLAAKGCGAMGADVLVLLHRPEARARVEAWAKGQALGLAGRAADIGARTGSGLAVETRGRDVL